MKFIFSNTLIFLFFCVSCNRNLSYKDVELFTIEDFGTSVLMSLESAAIEDVPLLTRKMAIHDSLLIAYSRGSENLVHIYNLNTGKKLKECIAFGSGPGEMLNIESLLAGDSVLLLGCVQDQSVKGFLYSSLLEDEIPSEYFKYNLETQTEGLTLGPDNSVIGVNMALEGGRLNFFDDQGKLVDTRGEFPSFGEELTQLETVWGFVGVICGNVTEDRIYLFCKMTDLLDVYDLSGNLLKRRQGPDMFFPQVKQRNFDNNTSTVSSKESRDAYFEPSVVEDKIFVIYTGTEYGKRETKTILVFDKEGNPWKHFKLDEDILTFTADEKNKMLYVVTMEDFEIKTFKYE